MVRVFYQLYKVLSHNVTKVSYFSKQQHYINISLSGRSGSSGTLEWKEVFIKVQRVVLFLGYLEVT
jgi:hypothetical protein